MDEFKNPEALSSEDLEELEALDDGNSENDDNGEGSKAPSSWRMVEIVQQTRFGFTPEIVDAALWGWKPVARYAWILHDKDVESDGTPKPPHVHLELEFRQPTRTEQIINRFRKVSKGSCFLPPQQLQKIGKSYAAACNYLTHIDAEPYKYRYSFRDVHANFDFEDFTRREHEKNADRFTASMQKVLLEAIASGEVREYMLTDPDFRPLLLDRFHLSRFNQIKFDQSIRRALRLQYAEAAADSSRDLVTFFIEGAPGIGKDVLANRIVQAYGAKAFRCNASAHPFDDYRGQPALIWSDARPSSLPFHFLLGAIDPYHSQSVAARYTDRTLLARLLILTSSQNLRTWYRSNFVSSDGHHYREDPSQLYRRLRVLLHVRYEDLDDPASRVVDFFLYDADRMRKFDRSCVDLEQAFCAGYEHVRTVSFDDVPSLLVRFFPVDFPSLLSDGFG